jgi:hypothetical protein
VFLIQFLKKKCKYNVVFLMSVWITVVRPLISYHFPFCEPPGHLAIHFLTCHLFGVFASYFDFAAFSRLAFPAPTRRKTFETAAERSSLNVVLQNSFVYAIISRVILILYATSCFLLSIDLNGLSNGAMNGLDQKTVRFILLYFLSYSSQLSLKQAHITLFPPSSRG